MTNAEALRALIASPELADVGRPKERATFMALKLDKRTVRDAAEVTGVSKSGVEGLAQIFQTKLTKRIQEIRKTHPESWSVAFREAYGKFAEGIQPDYETSHKTGNVNWAQLRNEDLTEAFGHHAETDTDET